MKGPRLEQRFSIRVMPLQRERINELIIEFPDRWKNESEFLRAAVHHFILAFEKKEVSPLETEQAIAARNLERISRRASGFTEARQ
jgi:Arc/MetJ-type ribon-helix-helix transcriptional regulator